MQKKLPVLNNPPSCDSGGCSSCSSNAGCGTRRDNRGVIVGGVLIAVVAAASLWVAVTDTAGRGASPPIAPPTMAVARTNVSPYTTVQPVAAITVARTPICQSAPMPHGWRGPCSSCHIVQACPGRPAAFQMAALATAAAATSPTAIAPPASVPTWIPSIDRSVLLPHLYAGICMNCHVILGGMPRPMNLDVPGLLPSDELLVRAGQRVIVPSPVETIKAPFIGRDSILPHAFKGVCSNCHTVVHAGRGPNPELASDGLTRARQRLSMLSLSDREIAHAQRDAGGALRRIVMLGSGFAALGLFLVSMVYVVMKLLMKSNPKRFRKRFNTKKWFRIHEWSSMGFALTAILHWGLSVQGNALLHASLVAIVLLTVSGIVYRQKAFKAHRKSMRWIHTQRSLTYVLLVFAILGHALIDYS